MPLWSQIAEELRDNAALQIAAVLATENRNNAAAKFVKGFPTLLWWHDGEIAAMYEVRVM